MQRHEAKIENLGALWDFDFFLADTEVILFENIILTHETI